MKYIFIFTLLISQLYSAPARGGMREFTQADGSTFKAMAKGNHHLNWIESEDGVILKYNPQTKNYELAEIKDQSLLPSGERYLSPNSTDAKRSQAINDKKVDKSEVYELWRKKQSEHNAKVKYRKY